MVLDTLVCFGEIRVVPKHRLQFSRGSFGFVLATLLLSLIMHLLLNVVLMTELTNVHFLKSPPGWNLKTQDISFDIDLEFDHVIEALKEAALSFLDFVTKRLLNVRKLYEWYVHKCNCFSLCFSLCTLR